MSEVCSEVVVRLGARDRRQLAADFVALTKPRVVLMVLVLLCILPVQWITRRGAER